MISSEDMRLLEEKAEEAGISKLTLMENAGSEVARILEEKMDMKGKRVLVACYHGNNGGDGFVAARYLAEKSEVDILFIGDESHLKGEALINFNRLEENPLIQFTSLDFVDFDGYDVIVDALLGIGIHGQLAPLLQSTIDAINNSDAFKVSVDIPSGLHPDTGEIIDKAVNADLVVMFHDIKQGLGAWKEKTVVADIGIPK
jgi:NAD(P)H-hydrate epimerase